MLAAGTSQIYSFETGAWRTGPTLPTSSAFSATLPLGDTFIVIGGKQRSGEGLTTVLEYDPVNEEFVVREETLSEEKWQVATVLVSPDVV